MLYRAGHLQTRLTLRTEGLRGRLHSVAGLHWARRYQWGRPRSQRCAHCPQPSHRLFPVTAGACLPFTKQVCGYCIPSLSGTVGMCVWPGWGEGTLNKQPMVPVNAKAHRPPSPDRGCSLDRVTRSRQNSFRKKGFGALPPTPQSGPIAPGRPPCSPTPLGLSPPNPPSGEQSRGPSALDRKLSAPLACRAGSLTAREGRLPSPSPAC